MGIRTKSSIWCLLAVLLAGYFMMLAVNRNINIDSNILNLLPQTEADIAVENAFNNFSEKSMQRLLFLVANKDRGAARQSAEELAQVLRSNPWLAEVILKHDDDEKNATGEFYYRYRHHLLGTTDRVLLTEGEYQSFSEDAIRQAYAPFSGGLINLLQTDPFLLSYRAGISSIMDDSLTLRLEDGYLGTQVGNESYVLLTAKLKQSPFNQELQQQVLTSISNLEKRWSDSAVDTRLIRTGALFYTAHAYDTASYEISLIGGGSAVLVLVLLLLSFSSIRPIILVMVALGFGIAAGFVTVRILFGSVHLLTMVFGASLIGVAVDYSFHYFVIDDADSGEARLKNILPAINLGLLTSTVGYAALLPTPFPGLQQMAVFCISGLIASYLTVVLLFPIVTLRNRNSPCLLGLCQKFLAWGEGSSAKRVLYIALLLPIFSLGLFIANKSTADDVRGFQAQNPELLDQEHTIQRILNIPSAHQFYLVKGSTSEELLTNVETTRGKLDALVARKIINGYLSITDWLPSIRQQKVNFELYRKLYESDAGQPLIEAGLISQDDFNSVREAFLRDQDNYLLPQDWLNSPPGRELGHLWLGEIFSNNEKGKGARNIAQSQGYAAVIALRGVNNQNLLEDIPLDNGKYAIFIDKVSTVNAILAAYRNNMTLFLLAVGGVIFVILCLRYALKRALLIMALPVISISTVMIGLVFLGEPLNLFHILSLCLVIGISVDFGIFSAEAGKPSAGTLLAVILSALSTIFSFGLLSLSATLAVHSFGLSTLIGISSAVLLSPIIGNLVIKSKQ